MKNIIMENIDEDKQSPMISNKQTENLQDGPPGQSQFIKIHEATKFEGELVQLASDDDVSGDPDDNQ